MESGALATEDIHLRPDRERAAMRSISFPEHRARIQRLD